MAARPRVGRVAVLGVRPRRWRLSSLSSPWSSRMPASSRARGRLGTRDRRRRPRPARVCDRRRGPARPAGPRSPSSPACSTRSATGRSPLWPRPVRKAPRSSAARTERGSCGTSRASAPAPTIELEPLVGQQARPTRSRPCRRPPRARDPRPSRSRRSAAANGGRAGARRRAVRSRHPAAARERRPRPSATSPRGRVTCRGVPRVSVTFE